MKKYTCLFILLNCITPFFLSAQTTVMSYNIRYDNPNDKENWWRYRKAEVVQMIDYYEPTILGIQEGLEHQVQYLDSALVSYSYAGVGRDDGKTKGEYTAIFFHRDRMSLLDCKTYWLSDTPDQVSVGWDAALERVVTFVTLLDAQSNDTLFVYNGHFDHRGKTARKNSAQLILDIIDQRSLDDEKVIVMGDFNCLPDDEPIEIFKTQLEDTFHNSEVISYGPIGTFNQFDTNAIMNRRIDYILVKNIEVTHYVHIDDRRQNNLHLSDHLPVMIKF